MTNQNLEQQIVNKLERIHGSPITEEQGGLVQREQARMLLDLLGHDVNRIEIESVAEAEFLPKDRTVVDVSEYVESCKSQDSGM